MPTSDSLLVGILQLQIQKKIPPLGFTDGISGSLQSLCWPARTLAHSRRGCNHSRYIADHSCSGRFCNTLAWKRTHLEEFIANSGAVSFCGFDHRPLHFNIWSAIFARQSARMEYNWGTVVSTSFLDWFRHVLGGQTPSQARNLDCRVVGLVHATFTLSGELVER